jgi:hypothetical protein
MRLYSSIYVPPLGIIPDSSDPLNRYLLATDTIIRARTDKINEAMHALYVKNNASFTALARRGRAEFETNDAWYTRCNDEIWSVAAFSYKKI